MSRQRVLFTLVCSLLGFLIVFASSLTSNHVITSIFRGGVALFISLFIGFIFHIIWGFITLDLLNKESSSEIDSEAEAANDQVLEKQYINEKT